MKRKSSTPSTGKRKLGDTSLDWITDTTESEAIIPEQAENNHDKSTGISQEKKIGVFKQYSYEEAEKKKDETPEVTPTISGSSSTIIKGKRVTQAKKEEAQKAEFKEEKKPTNRKEAPSIPVDSAEITGSAGKTPVEIGKTYRITEEYELILADEEEKTVSDKKEDMPDDKKTPLEYEVKKEDVTIKEEISKEPSVRIPDDSSSIVKKRKKTAAKGKKIKEEEKPTAEKKEIAAAAAKEEVPPSAKRKWMSISVAGESLKKGSEKLSGAIAKPFKSDKTKLKKSVSHVINVSKKPVKAISAVDRKITQSVKKIIMSGDPGVAAKSILNNIKSTDAQITKSAKKLIDSVLD